MRRFVLFAAFAAAALVAVPPANADDLRGAERFLCSAVEATVCVSEGVCESAPPWTWNIPQFLVIDLAAKTISTTAGSGENRSTPILSSGREEGVVYVQGFERQRAFSIVISEATGWATAAVAREEVAVSVFAACTPQK